MKYRMTSLPFLLVAALFVSGCAVNRETASLTPGSDLNQLKNFYVVKFSPDERGVNIIIMNDLISRGYQATTGPEDAAPANVDAVVTYRDKWMWDITMYMLELDITLRNPKTKYPIAVGNSYHTSLTRKSSEEMVKEVLTNIFNKSAGTDIPSTTARSQESQAVAAVSQQPCEPKSPECNVGKAGSIMTGEEFKRLVVDRLLSGNDGQVSLTVRSDGKINGTRMDGTKISGPWYFKDGYFCREAILDEKSTGWDCQVVRIAGNDIYFHRRRGSGDKVRYSFK